MPPLTFILSLGGERNYFSCPLELYKGLYYIRAARPKAIFRGAANTHHASSYGNLCRAITVKEPLKTVGTACRSPTKPY